MKTHHKEELNCPTCGLTLRQQEVESHLEHEVAKLYKLPQSRPPSQRPNPSTRYSLSHNLWDPVNPTNDDRCGPIDTRDSGPSSTHVIEHAPTTSSGEGCHLLTSTDDSVPSLEEMDGLRNEATRYDENGSDPSTSDPSESSSSSFASGPSSSAGVRSLSGRGGGAAAARECIRRTADQQERAQLLRALRAGRAARHRDQLQRVQEVQERTCPHCSAVLHRDHFPAHMDNCQEPAEDSSEGEEGILPEYHWCGETRVRVTDLLRSQGQLHALGTVVERGPEDDEVDVCNDTDDFGPQQFFESDAATAHPLDDESIESAGVDNRSFELNSNEVVHEASSHRSSGNQLASTTDDAFPLISFEEGPMEKFKNQCDNLRICSEATVDYDAAGSSRGPEVDNLSNPSKLESTASNCQTKVTSDRMPCPLRPVVDSLILKIKKLELQVTNNRSSASRCSVCRDEFDQPLVSTGCWHVHCRQCWMSTLINKRQCPQCLAIFNLSDLRRIYL